MPFTKLGLSSELLRAIKDQGYKEPTPIQAQAIPPILEGKDIMAGAQTGTGKTAGFTLPMLRKLQPHASTSVSPAKHPIRALVLVPTRELAVQVHDSVKTYGKYIPLRSAVVYGGVDMDAQIKELHTGVEILVATPGRLLDHVQNRTVNLSRVEILVLDEADRMLDMGFLPDIRRILALLPAKRQNLLFSATFSEEIKRLADQLLNKPVLIEVARRNAMAELVTHVVHPVEEDNKRELLAHLIKAADLRQVLVFTNTKRGTDRLAHQLRRDGIEATPIHGDMSQPERTKALTDFKEGRVRVLVATDVAARGLDIEELPHVFNFDLPHDPENYVHRIGRTGRAGSRGDAVSLVSPADKERLRDIERLLKISLPVQVVAGFDAKAGSKREAAGQSGRYHDRARPESKPAEGRRRTQREPRSKAPVDSIFTQPYEPSTPAPTESEPAAESHARPHHGRHKKKPVPALFLPPGTGKHKH